jgi:hypothetical protein
LKFRCGQKKKVLINFLDGSGSVDGFRAGLRYSENRPENILGLVQRTIYRIFSYTTGSQPVARSLYMFYFACQ